MWGRMNTFSVCAFNRISISGPLGSHNAHTGSTFLTSLTPPQNTPLPVGITLDQSMSSKTDSERKEMIDKLYCLILGSVMWGQLATHPDLSFVVSLLSHFQTDPGIKHWKTLLHVDGYIQNTMDYGLTYSQNADLTP